MGDPKKTVKPDLRSLYIENLGKLREWGIRAEAIEQIARASNCKTEYLGAEVYASENGEELNVWHTCKSRCCPSCGYFRSLLWMADICARVPDIPCTPIVFTMRSPLWEIFKRNRTLLRALPEIGARVVQDWAKNRYGADVVIVVVQHTFGAALNFNVHLHLIASNVGISPTNDRLIQDIEYSPEQITQSWQQILIAYLLSAAKEEWVRSDLEQKNLLTSISNESEAKDWVRLVKKLSSVHQYLRYMGRYLCRQPITNNRLLPSEPGSVNFEYWRKLKKHEPTSADEVRTRFGTRKRLCTKECTVQEFFELLADQVPDSYTHGPRYFGLLAPRSAPRYLRFLALLGKVPADMTRKTHRWSYWLWKRFGKNPLRDSQGGRLKWARSIPPRAKRP